MDWITLIGLLAATGTTTAFLPQVIKAVRSRRTSDISLVMYIIFIVGLLLWIVYGVLTIDVPVIVANFITVFLALIVLSLKLEYG